MAFRRDRSDERDLPWDPLWEYVLGDDDEEGRDEGAFGRAFRRKPREDQGGDGPGSYAIYGQQQQKQQHLLQSQQTQSREARKSFWRGKRGAQKDENKQPWSWTILGKQKDTAAAGSKEVDDFHRYQASEKLKEPETGEPSEQREQWQWKLDLNGSIDAAEGQQVEDENPGGLWLQKGRNKVPEPSEQQTRDDTTNADRWQWKLDLNGSLDTDDGQVVAGANLNEHRSGGWLGGGGGGRGPKHNHDHARDESGWWKDGTIREAAAASDASRPSSSTGASLVSLRKTLSFRKTTSLLRR
jgi:hypothetical protein